jgi:ParB family chromosome partitioning protein
MVTKKPKGLGMGLEALLGPKVEEKAEQAQAVRKPTLACPVRCH